VTDWQDYATMLDRYGKGYEVLYVTLMDEMEKVKGGDLEKITGAVSSTTVGMESKPRYSHKKEDEEYAR
jgi:hypothetical protein